MPNFSGNEIDEAKRRVEEMRKKSLDYIADDEFKLKENKNKPKQINQDSDNNSFLGDLGGLLNFSDDNSFGLILAIVLILSKEGADNKLIFALLYILL